MTKKKILFVVEDAANRRPVMNRLYREFQDTVQKEGSLYTIEKITKEQRKQPELKANLVVLDSSLRFLKHDLGILTEEQVPVKVIPDEVYIMGEAKRLFAELEDMLLTS
ncbi:hypothetical protein [Enterococcus sp. LJL90]